MTTISFHVDEKLNMQISELAKTTERSKSYIMRKALEYFVMNYKSPNAETKNIIDEARAGKSLSKIEDFSVFLDRL